MSYSVLSYLDNILAKSPNKIAYSDENNAYTFREIDCLSDSIAAWLIENGYKNEPVSIMVERDAIVPAYYFAVAKAACFYAPMEATLPLQRLKQIMQVVKSRLLLVDEKSPLSGTTNSRSISGSVLFTSVFSARSTHFSFSAGQNLRR